VKIFSSIRSVSNGGRKVKSDREYKALPGISVTAELSPAGKYQGPAVHYILFTSK